MDTSEQRKLAAQIERAFRIVAWLGLGSVASGPALLLGLWVLGFEWSPPALLALAGTWVIIVLGANFATALYIDGPIADRIAKLKGVPRDELPRLEDFGL